MSIACCGTTHLELESATGELVRVELKGVVYILTFEKHIILIVGRIALWLLFRTN